MPFLRFCRTEYLLGEGKQSKMADWTELSPDLLQLISQNITVYQDYIRFRAVCHNWRSPVPENPSHLPPQLPCLLIPRYHCSSCGLFIFSDNRIHFLHLPEASHGKRRCGSSHGWLAILDETPTILLLNPMTKATLRLPPLSTFPNVVSFDSSRSGREYEVREFAGQIRRYSLRKMRDYFVNKIVLSSNPSNQNGFTAIAILRRCGNLAFYRSGGDGSWSFVDDGPSSCEDAIYSDCDGVFYAVDCYGVVSVIDLRDSRPKVSRIATGRRYICNTKRYVVRSGDELLLVIRYLDDMFSRVMNEGLNCPFMRSRTLRFEVFRMEWEGPEWEKMESLNGMALFLGKNSSIAFSAADFPEISENCIYYTDDYCSETYIGECQRLDVGIFRLSDENFESVATAWNSHSSSSSIMRPSLSLPPIWISPNPC